MTPRRIFSFATMMVSAQRRHARTAGLDLPPEPVDKPALVLVKESKESAASRPAVPKPTPPWLQLA